MTRSRKGICGVGTIRNEKGFGPIVTLDATEARNHIHSALAFGMTTRSIAAHAGVTPRTITNIRDGQPSIKSYINNAILAVEIGVADETTGGRAGPLVPSLGARRRIEALAAIGWPKSELARRAGCDVEWVGRRSYRITRKSHDRIAALYDELCMTPGPSGKARTWAAKRGYLPPLTWDDPDTDPEPPTSSFVGVDDAAIWRALDGDKTVELGTAERHEVIRTLHARGLTDMQIEDRTGIKQNTVGVTRLRMGLPLNPATIDWSEYGERRRDRTARKAA